MTDFRYLYGYFPVVMALESDSLITIKKVFLVANKYTDLTQKLVKNNIAYEFTSQETINNILKNSKNQGICAEVARYQTFVIEDLLKQKPKNKYFRFLICDKITDPHNFGSLVRIAAATNFDGIIILNRNQVQVNGVVAKGAVGALSAIKIAIASNLSVVIKKMQDAGIWSVVTANSEKATEYNILKYDFPIAIIIGNEGDGVSKNLIKNADYVVKIPISQAVESLNASVAFGIIACKIYQETIK